MYVNAIPVIDIAPLVDGSPEQARDVAKALGAACREVGFFYISGHGVPAELMKRVFDTSAAFFTGPASVRDAVSFDGPGSNRPFGLVQVGQNAARSLEKGLALGGEQQLARRAIEQPRAQAPLQPRHKFADRRRRQAQSASGRRKAAQFDGPDEHFHLARAIDLRSWHDELNSQMLILLAVYFIASRYSILTCMTDRGAPGLVPEAIRCSRRDKTRNRRRYHHGSAPE